MRKWDAHKSDFPFDNVFESRYIIEEVSVNFLC